MKEKRFKKYYEELDISEVCALCEHACGIYSDTECLCRFRGVVENDFHCRKFVYDLTKRIPHRIMHEPFGADPEWEETEAAAAVDENIAAPE